MNEDVFVNQKLLIDLKIRRRFFPPDTIRTLRKNLPIVIR